MNTLTITRDDLDQAARGAGLSPGQAAQLWDALAARPASTVRARFDLANVAYYFGALIILGAMGWFMNQAWDLFNGLGISAIALCYGILFTLIGRRFWADPERRIPGGLLLTAAVGMVPLLVFGLEKATGFWPANDPGGYSRFHPYIDASWIIMEVATVLAGLIYLRRWAFPFLTAPIAYSLWYLSMDLPAYLFSDAPYTWEEKKLISVLYGLVMLAVAYIADFRTRKNDYAFWGYLFGLATFWGGLTAMDSDSELSKLGYCAINLGLMFCSLMLRRVTFIVFGALGVFIYLSHLAYEVFKDSFIFPFVLSFLGLGIIYLGIQYQKRHARVEQLLGELILPHIGNLLPERLRQ